jgi:DNA-binding NtrC family response regulator
MPAISLDENARQLLENHYWKGNIRQLKNVAEQISAIEEARLITEPILRKYLPAAGSGQAAMVMGGPSEGDFADERELLYKILFDLKSDMNDIKRMLIELSGGYTPHTSEPAPTHAPAAALLQPHTPHYVREAQDAIG